LGQQKSDQKIMDRQTMKLQLTKALQTLQKAAEEQSVPMRGAQAGIEHLLNVFNTVQYQVRNTTAVLQDILVHWDDVPEPEYVAMQTVDEVAGALVTGIGDGDWGNAKKKALIVEYEAGEYGAVRAYLAWPPKTQDDEVVLTLIDE